MKILCFIDNLGSGGAQRQLVNLAVLFKQNGHEVKFLVYGDNDFFAAKLQENKIEIVKILSNNYISRLLKIRKFIRKGWQDIVISFLETPNFISCFSALGKHKWKLITNERSGSIASFQGIKNKIYKKFEKFSNYTVCNSYVAKQMWLEQLPFVKNRIDVIYNYIEINQQKGEYIPLKNDVVNIVVVASYQYIKNIISVVDALNMLTFEEKSKIKIDWYGKIEVVKGDRQAYDEAIKLIDSYSLHSVITLHEENKEIYSVMNNSDFVGLFSKYEGLPNVICEAIMLGKPVIMTPVSDYKNLVKKNGFICKSTNANDIAEILREISQISHKDLINMSKECEFIAEELFDHNNIYQKWMSVFEKIFNADIEQRKKI